MITREFNLYLHAGHSIPLVINANQYDHGEQWLFKLFNSDGTQYVPSSGAIVGIKSDNLGIINSGSVDAQGRVVINETQQMTAAVGKAVFELVIDDGTHGTANFVVLVEPKPGNNADLSETDISMIEQAIEAASTIKPYGSPLVASTVAGMTDHEKVYVYVGSETGYTSGHWYYYDGSDWTDGGVYNSVAVQTDTTLTLSGVAADAKKTGDEISDLKSAIAAVSGGRGLSEDVKQALLSCFKNVAWISADGQDYYDALEAALYPPANLVSISAVYTQSGTVYDTDSLDDLKSDLVVTATWSDSSTSTVASTDYTLSGTLTEGTSTITATYGGKSTTFTVNVTASLIPADYQQVEYIQSTGTQHIITDIAGFDNANNENSVKYYSFDIDFKFDEWQSAYATNIIAGFGSNGGKWIGYSNAVQQIAMGTQSGNYFTSGTVTDRHQYHWSIINGVGTVERDDGVQISRSVTYGTAQIDLPFGLFQIANASQNFHFSGKLYSVIVYKNDTPVLHGVPCYQKSDNVIGLYDIVNDRFYTNDGTGTFQKGDNV